MYATMLSHRAEQTLFSEDSSAPYVLLLSVTKKGKRTRPIVSIPGIRAKARASAKNIRTLISTDPFIKA
jgi:hypothetical protein